jgi:uncharacterized protein YqeY
METRQLLNDALKNAMRAGDGMRTQAIRMVLSNVKLSEVEKGSPLDEAGVISVIQKEIKSRVESIQDAQKASRPDLITKAESEIAFLETFLPKQLSADELAELVRQAVVEVNATNPADMGKVMKALMPKVQGRAAGNLVSEAVRKQLQN